MLGYQSNPHESSNDILLRICAITQALDAGDKEYEVFFPSSPLADLVGLPLAE
jgi:hypothetical protein